MTTQAEIIEIKPGGLVHGVPEEFIENLRRLEVEIINEREGGLVDCWVPSGLIDHEEVPVKEEWVESLVKDMKQVADQDGGTGQITPIILGQIESEDKLKIIDGFHRDAALRGVGESHIYATVKQVDWDGLFDLRIFTAKDHAHVRFSRVVQWIQEVWQFSGLAEKISVEQAVLLYRFDTSGQKLGLTDEEVSMAKEWVAKKEEQWQMAAMTMHSHLKVAEHVDPKIVHATRAKKSGHKLEAPTQPMLKELAKQLPNQFGKQHLVVETAIKHNLKSGEIKALCQLVAGSKSIRQARTAVEGIDWAKWEPVYHESTNRSLRRAHDPRHKGAVVLSDARKVIERTLERARLAIKRGDEVDDAMRENLADARREAQSLMRDLGTLTIKLSQLMGDIEVPLARRTDLASIAEESDEFLKLHAKWGLAFKVYEDEPSPTVYLSGTGLFTLGDVPSSIAYILARTEPGKDLDIKYIQDALADAGHNDGQIIPESTVRRAVTQLASVLKSKGKENHLIVRTAGSRKMFVTMAP